MRLIGDYRDKGYELYYWCHEALRHLPEKLHNFAPGPNLRFDLISYFRETDVFAENLFIDEIVISPLFAKGNGGIENHFFMQRRSLEAGLVHQVLWCWVSNNCDKCCNYVILWCCNSRRNDGFFSWPCERSVQLPENRATVMRNLK